MEGALEHLFISLTQAINTHEKMVTIHCLEVHGHQYQFIIKLTEVSGIKKIT